MPIYQAREGKNIFLGRFQDFNCMHFDMIEDQKSSNLIFNILHFLLLFWIPVTVTGTGFFLSHFTRCSLVIPARLVHTWLAGDIFVKLFLTWKAKENKTQRNGASSSGLFTIIIAGAIVMEIVIQRETRESGARIVFTLRQNTAFLTPWRRIQYLLSCSPQIPDKERIHPLYSPRIILLLWYEKIRKLW